MSKRFIVKNVVSDYGVFDTKYLGGEHLDCICMGRRNADLIADILNCDYSKPNECTYYENKLIKENAVLKEALKLACETIYNNIVDEEDYYARVDYAKSYFIEQAKEGIK